MGDLRRFEQRNVNKREYISQRALQNRDRRDDPGDE